MQRSPSRVFPKPHQLVPMMLCLLAATLAVAAGDEPAKPEPIKHQVTGLFCPDREDDLREVVEKLPGIKLVSIDFANAEASFRYDSAKVFPGAKPEQVIERFNNLLRDASHHTFGLKPLRTAPKDKLTLIEIPVAGLDCKACCLAAYESIYKLDGVECATASFKEGRVTALVDPAKTSRAALEAALRQRGVPSSVP